VGPFYHLIHNNYKNTFIYILVSLRSEVTSIPCYYKGESQRHSFCVGQISMNMYTSKFSQRRPLSPTLLNVAPLAICCNSAYANKQLMDPHSSASLDVRASQAFLLARLPDTCQDIISKVRHTCRIPASTWPTTDRLH
jgi:hypothetical protein